MSKGYFNKRKTMSEIEQHINETEEAKLGSRLREAREFLGLSQESVATAMELPRATISAIESGKRKVIGTELHKFAALYKRELSFFFDSQPSAEDASVAAIYRATKDLSQTDRDQVIRFAEFLRGAGSAPKPTDG